PAPRPAAGATGGRARRPGRALRRTAGRACRGKGRAHQEAPAPPRPARPPLPPRAVGSADVHPPAGEARAGAGGGGAREVARAPSGVSIRRSSVELRWLRLAMADTAGELPCPGCGFLVYGPDAYGSYGICPLCDWEDCAL